jgi:hypothetical protein
MSSSSLRSLLGAAALAGAQACAMARPPAARPPAFDVIAEPDEPDDGPCGGRLQEAERLFARRQQRAELERAIAAY